MVSDHLGEDDEWEWVKGFAKETGLPVTLVATSAGAYEGDKMYNIAEESRLEGMDIRPQIAGRPTGVLQGLQSNFHVFVAHPTYRREIAHLPLAEKVAAMQRPGDPRGPAGGGDRGTQRPDPRRERRTSLLSRVFPLGEQPRLRARSRSRAWRAWPRRPA